MFWVILLIVNYNLSTTWAHIWAKQLINYMFELSHKFHTIQSYYQLIEAVPINLNSLIELTHSEIKQFRKFPLEIFTSVN